MTNKSNTVMLSAGLLLAQCTGSCVQIIQTVAPSAHCAFHTNKAAVNDAHPKADSLTAAALDLVLFR